MAQPAPPRQLPGPAQPGRLDRDLDPPPEPLAVPRPAAPLLTPAEPGPRVPGLEIPVRDFVFRGNTVFSVEELRAELQRYIGQSITTEQFAEIEEAIARRYRNDGYILGQAIVPADQELDPDGAVIRIDVIEGYINTVRLDPLDYEVGEKGQLVRAILKKVERVCRPGDEAKDGKPCPLHVTMLERYLLLANDLPGVKATAVIQPSSDATGAADLFVTIDEKGYSGFAKVDNRGSVYIGPFRADVGGSLNNLTGFYDRTTARIVAAKPYHELLLWNIVEDVPIGAEGLRVGVDVSHSSSTPGDILRINDIHSHSRSAGITATYPWLRTRSENLFLRTGFEWRESDTQLPHNSQLFEDRTRDVSVGATYDLADRYLGVNLVDVKYTQGLPFFNPTPHGVTTTSRTGVDAGGEFAKVTFEASRLQRLFPELNLLVAVTGQYAFSTLVAGEEFGFGGDRYGRAYDPSEVLGDHGIAAKLELQYNPAAVGEVLGWTGLSPSTLRTLQFYTYYDFGMVWQRPANDTLASVGSTQKDRDSGAAAGVGIRFNVNDWVSGYAEVAQPLTRPVAERVAKSEDGKATRYFFSLATQF